VQHPRTVAVLEPAQQLVQQVPQVLLAQGLSRPDDLVQVRVEQLHTRAQRRGGVCVRARGWRGRDRAGGALPASAPQRNCTFPHSAGQ
jgi:hypothetical protein